MKNFKTMPQDTTATIEDLRDMCDKFREDRNWTKATPATFAKDIIVEAGELLEYFVWNENSALQNPDLKQEIEYELADIFYAVLIMSKTLEMDLSKTLISKLKILEKKYPIAKCKKMMKESPKNRIKQLHQLKSDFKKNNNNV